MKMKEIFEEFIEQISENNGIHVVGNEAGAGSSTFLLEVAFRNLKKGKKILFVDIDHGTNNNPWMRSILDSEFRDNFALIQDRNIDFLTEEVLDNFDIVIIDTMNHYVEALVENDFGIARLSRAYQQINTRMRNFNKVFIYSNHMRRNITLDSQGSSLLGGTSVMYSASTCMILRRDGEKIIASVIKNRFSNIVNRSFNFEPKERGLSFFDGFIPNEELFFKERKDYNKNDYLLKILHDKMRDYSLEEYLDGYSVKRKEKFKNVLFLEDKSINYYFLNTFELMKLYDEFNIDDFILEENKFKYKLISNTLRVGVNLAIEQNALIPFFKNCISYKRAVKLFSDYMREDNPAGWSLLYAIGTIYSSLLSDKENMKKININNLFDWEKELHKDRFKKKKFTEIIIYLEDLKRKVEAVLLEHRHSIVEIKQDTFAKKNKDFNDSNYTLEVPRKIEEVIEGGKYFNNCTKSGFFIKRFLENRSILFYLKNKKDSKKDLCIETSVTGELIEVAGLSNERIYGKNQKVFKKALSMLKF